MLGKLIKYDFRSCLKRFWPIWSAVIVISIINGWSLYYCTQNNNYTFLPNVLPKLLLFGVAIAGIVIALIYVYNEFCHGLLGREGYLMFTLPVKEEELIFSKFITALIMFVISGIVVFAGTIIMAYLGAPEYIGYRVEEMLYMFIHTKEKSVIILFLLECGVFCIASATAFIFHIYTAVSAGHLIPRYRRIIGVVTFILLCIISICILINIVFPLMSKAYNSVGYVYGTWKQDLLPSMAAIGTLILCELIYSALLMLAVRYVLKNRLNLE